MSQQKETMEQALLWLANYVRYDFGYLTTKYNVVHLEKLTVERVMEMYLECKDIGTIAQGEFGS